MFNRKLLLVMFGVMGMTLPAGAFDMSAAFRGAISSAAAFVASERAALPAGPDRQAAALNTVIAEIHNTFQHAEQRSVTGDQTLAALWVAYSLSLSGLQHMDAMDRSDGAGLSPQPVPTLDLQAAGLTAQDMAHVQDMVRGIAAARRAQIDRLGLDGMGAWAVDQLTASGFAVSGIVAALAPLDLSVQDLGTAMTDDLAAYTDFANALCRPDAPSCGVGSAVVPDLGGSLYDMALSIGTAIQGSIDVNLDDAADDASDGGMTDDLDVDVDMDIDLDPEGDELIDRSGKG